MAVVDEPLRLRTPWILCPIRSILAGLLISKCRISPAFFRS